MARVFLDAQGGELAFFKEDEQPDWSTSVYRDVAQSDIPEAEPSSTGASNGVDVRQARNALLIFKPSDTSAHYSYKVYAGVASDHIEDFYPTFGKGKKNVVGKAAVTIGVQEMDELFVGVEELSAGSIEVEYAKIPIEM